MHVVDIASGAGHLSASVKEVLSDTTIMHHLIEVDPDFITCKRSFG